MAQDLENGHKINVQFRFGRRRIRLGIVENGIYTIMLPISFFIVKSCYHKKISILFVNSLKYSSISIIY